MKYCVNTFLFLLILTNILEVSANPKLFSSDWPVWHLTDGMHKKGLLDRFNYRNKSYDTCIRWFNSGSLDITFMTLYDFIAIQPTKHPTVILGITDYSNGGDKIIARKSIKEAKDLKGKKILLPSNTISLWFLQNYLNKHGLDLNDVEIVDQSENLAALQFKEDSSFSAVVGWNPIIDRALNSDSYVAATSADLPEVIYDIIVAKKSFVDKNSDLVETFLSNFYKSIHDEDIISKTAQGLSLSSKEYKSMLQDAYVFPSKIVANRQYQKLVHQSKKIVKFLETAPKSLKNQSTIARFHQRKIDINSIIYFKSKN